MPPLLPRRLLEIDQKVDEDLRPQPIRFRGLEDAADVGEKVDAGKKGEAEALIAEVREALKGETTEPIKEKAEALARLMTEIGTAAYQASQAAGESAGAGETAGEAPEGETIEGEAKEV